SLPDRHGHRRPPYAAAPRRAAAAALPPRRGAAQRARPVRLDARRLPAAAPRHARGARRLRRGLPSLRRGHRSPVPRDASRLGALVRARVGGAARAPGRHRPPAPDARDDLALGRDRALRAPTSGAAARTVSAIDKFDRLAPGYAAHDYADPERYAARRADLALAVGPQLPPAASVPDPACADANMPEPLLARGPPYPAAAGTRAMTEERRPAPAAP